MLGREARHTDISQWQRTYCHNHRADWKRVLPMCMVLQEGVVSRRDSVSGGTIR